MKVWSCRLDGRLSRKSSSTLENMAEEDTQSIHNDNNHFRTLRDHMNPTRIGSLSCIVFSLSAFHFNFKLGIIQLLPNFHGLVLENSYLRLIEFEKVNNTYNDLNCKTRE
jgi:hypothetical protein